MTATTRWKQRLQEASPTVRALLLTAALLAAGLVLSPFGYSQAQWLGVGAVGIACGVCLLAGLSALLLQSLVRQPQLAMLQVMIGFFLRMGLPLGFCFIVYGIGGPLVDAGLVFYLMPLYLVMLAAETLLLLSGLEQPRSGSTSRSTTHLD